MKREAVNHTKMKRLCRRLDVPLYVGVGILESLWHLTAREAPRGDIGKLSDEDIALAIDYRGDESKLIDGLVAAGWIDRDGENRLVIHDWFDHADDAVHMRLARNREYFCNGCAPKLARLAHGERTACAQFYGSSAQNDVLSALPEPRQSPASAPPEPVPDPVPVPEAPRTSAPAQKPTPDPVPINQARWKTDPLFRPFMETAGAAWGNLIDSDFDECYQTWRVLDFEQQAACIANIQARVAAHQDFRFVFRPGKFLRMHEWKRPARASPEKQKSRTQSSTDEALEIARRQQEMRQRL